MNACFSALQASYIVKYVDFVIGINQPIKDKSAIQFVIGFYDALVVGKSIPTAFKLGRTNIQGTMPGAEAHLKLVLKQRLVDVDNFWLMPIPENRLFTGRQAILHQLRDRLHFRQVAALSGFGGIGKTQTAAHYARLHRHEYRTVLWCLADRVESLNLGLAAIARLLDLPEKETTEQEIIIAAVKDWLMTHTHWLLILDNVDEVKMVSKLTALAKGEAQHVLLTTRAQVTEPFAQVAIHKMSQDEGVRFLLHRALDKPRDKYGEVWDYTWRDERNAGKLVGLLGALPLALDQAGAYIRETQCDLAEYLDRYQTHGQALLQERGMLYCSQDHPESVAIPWLLSFEKIAAENPTAIDILRLCAFLHPDSIPEEVFQEWDVFALDKALKVILKYSFIKRHPKIKILTIHRLVQTILRHEMNETTRRGWAEKTVRVVNSVFPDIEFKNWATCERLLPCAQICAKLIEEWKLVFEEAGRLLNEMGCYLYDAKADYEQAKPLYEGALAIKEKVFGKEHPEVAISLNNLGLLYKTQDKYAKAKPLYERALAIHEKVFGKEHPDVANSLNNLAVLYDSQGNYERAKPLYKTSLAIKEKFFGKEHPSVATSLNNLAVLYRSQGNYFKAKPLFEGALTISEKVFGEEHPDVATSLNGLALLYYNQGEYEQAKPLYERALNIANKFFKPDHPDVRLYSKNYAILLEKMKKPTKAGMVTEMVGVLSRISRIIRRPARFFSYPKKK